MPAEPPLSPPRVAVVLVAAGRGQRLGGGVPKQYLTLGDSCALRRSAEVFLAQPQVGEVLAVIHPDDTPLYDAAMGNVTDTRLTPPVVGGATRAASVRKGLEGLAATAPDWVLIHDAARPFVSTRILTQMFATLEMSPGVCAALPIVDALWRGEDGRAVAPVARDGLWRAQTPQGFHFDAIYRAHLTHDGTGSDDVHVAREAGIEVALIPGDESNYKITTQADLARAREDVSRLDLGKQAPHLGLQKT